MVSRIEYRARGQPVFGEEGSVTREALISKGFIVVVSQVAGRLIGVSCGVSRSVGETEFMDEGVID